MPKPFIKVIGFISVAGVILACLAVISGQHPVSVRDREFDAIIEEAVAKIYSTESVSFQALVAGCSHGRAINLDDMGLKGVNLSMPWLDFFETDYQLRLLLPRLSNVRTVFIAIPYFAFVWDNGLSQDSQLLLSRRLFYYRAPTIQFMPGDVKNFIKGKMWRLLRADHWGNVFFSSGTFATANQNGSPMPDAFSENPALLEQEARKRVDETVAYCQQVIARDSEVRERVFGLLVALINDLAARNVRVILFTPPYYFKYTEYFRAEIIRHMRDTMRRLQGACNVEYYDFSESLDFIRSEHFFENSDHLNKGGVHMFSLKLEKVISDNKRN
ncbi:MAG: hypothetical protein A2036_01370 [Omnitrophica bacterium GWA2_50_21]|nr:MAG: hypothetical protein A2036_01370 [Omnitrophica bacterium GWA2_50_21]